MIEKVIPDKISFTLPTVFGEELTFLEFCGKLRAKLNECIDGINENTTDIQQNTTDIQQNTFKISRNEKDIVDLKGVVNSISAQTDENKVDIQQNTSDIQQNTTDIQQNTFKISKNEKDIVDLKGVVDNISAQADENTEDILNRKIESLFAPVILNVENHSPGADINAAVYVRICRINPQSLGCLYAKINLSFSGEINAKTLEIDSIQFGDRKALNITSASTSFTAKTDVISLPISILGNPDIPAGTSDIAVTGINLFGMSIVAESLASSFSLDSIPTGIDIPCESLEFSSPAGGEEDFNLIYTFKASEGCFDILTTAAGTSGVTPRAYLQTDFTNILSDSKVFARFLCSGGAYNGDTISTVPDNGAPLGVAMINYTGYTEGIHLYNARITVKTLTTATGTNNLLKNTGMASQSIPFGQFARVSLTFDMFN